MSEKKAWERLNNESLKAYEAFKAYLELGIKRSVDAAYEKYCGAKVEQEWSKRASSRWFNWSTSNNWVERAKAWDDENNQSVLLAKSEKIKKSIDEYKNDRLKNSKKLSRLGRRFIKLVNKRINRLEQIEKSLNPSTTNELTKTELLSIARAYDLNTLAFTASIAQKALLAASEDTAKVLCVEKLLLKLAINPDDEQLPENKLQNS